jgi:hypothetical protein
METLPETTTSHRDAARPAKLGDVMSAPASSSLDFAGMVPDSARSNQRLNLEPTGSHQGMLDGAWWPRSRRAGRELPGLILMIDSIRGQVLRLVLAASGWDDRPPRLMVGGRSVILEYFGSQPATLLTARCVHSRVDLLVIPPATGRETAYAAMMRAMSTGNRVAAARTAMAPVQSPSAHTASPSTSIAAWENDGGGLSNDLRKVAG